jgi:hypothetical protein
MRPVGKPLFQVIVVDVADWVSQGDARSLIRRQVIPEWFKEDILERSKGALLVVLSPSSPNDEIRQAVTLHVKRIQGSRPSVAPEFFLREWLGQHETEQIVKLLAQRWFESDKKEDSGDGGVVESLLERFGTPK